jgi:addiction module RelE/StbE family toxin
LKIKLSRLALQDLQATKDYISQDKPSAAHAVIQRVMEAVENIVTFPSIGRPGRVPYTKELVVSSTPLIIVYQIRLDTLFIVRLIHTARKWP